ncbi:MAG: acyl carrier protein [Bacteroidetes bacterium]|nr:MAG: acyl carrier protein [Bacteroidota bacterium]
MDKKKSLTEDKLIEFVSWELDVPAEEIFPSSSLVSDLNLDDQDKMLLIAELENRMDVYLTPEEAEKAETIQDLKQCFHAHLEHA